MNHPSRSFALLAVVLATVVPSAARGDGRGHNFHFVEDSARLGPDDGIGRHLQQPRT